MKSNFVAKKQTSIIVYILIFIYFLITMRCWIGFEGRTYLYHFIFPILMSLCLLFGKVYLKLRKRYVVFSLIVFLVTWINAKGSLNLFGIIEKFIPAFNILLILSIPDNEKEILLAKVIKWFGYIILLSLIIYFATLLTSIPNFGIIEADYGSKDVIAGDYANYLFYIQPLKYIETGILPRFNGPFIEPGDLGCVASFILMAARFNFKRYKNLNYILLSLVVSFSLAGYILTAIGYILILLLDNRISSKNLLFFLTLLCGIYLFGTFYNGGDNLINDLILSRMQIDEDKGFTGNNRATDVIDAYFLFMWSDTTKLLFGYDQATINYIMETGLGAGFKREMVCTGLVGVIGICLPYLYFMITSPAKRYPFYFFLIFLLYVYQRTDTLWISFILTFVYGIYIYENEQLLNTKIRYEKNFNN